MNSLISGLSKSFSKLNVNNTMISSNSNSGIMNFMQKRYYSLILDSVEIPNEIEEKFKRPHRDQPTRAHKLLVKRQHQTKINLKRAKSQRIITDWRLAPPHHLPKFDAEKVKLAKTYTGDVADKFEDVPFGYKQRKHQKLLEKHQEEKQILEQIKQKRLKRHIESITKEKERKEAFKIKMEGRINDQQQQQQE